MTVLTDLTTAVLTRLGNPSTDGFYTTAIITDLINEAILTISTEGDWPWLHVTGTAIPTVNATATYAIGDAGYTKTRVLCIDGYDPLIERSLLDIRGMPTAAKARPLYFAVSNLTVHLRPVPDAVYSIAHDIVSSEVALAGAAAPLLPVAYYFAIVAKAAELGHLRQRDSERAMAQLAEYTAWMTRMRDNVRRTSPAFANWKIEASK